MSTSKVLKYNKKKTILDQYRIDSKLFQSQIAEELGCTQSQVSRYSARLAKMPTNYIKKLYKLLLRKNYTVDIADIVEDYANVNIYPRLKSVK